SVVEGESECHQHATLEQFRLVDDPTRRRIDLDVLVGSDKLLGSSDQIHSDLLEEGHRNLELESNGERVTGRLDDLARFLQSALVHLLNAYEQL
ncbi:hypothetical protein PFISCL1PPCAC_7802, partial [Pristionchus fissidentatus]